jgi:glycosyltransferase involved in cell wall biosynthesis
MSSRSADSTISSPEDVETAPGLVRRAEARATVVHLTSVPISLAYVVGHLRSQVEAGYRVHVISSPGPDLEKFCSESGAAAHPVEIPRQIDPFGDLRALRHIIAKMRGIRPDIVHAHTPKAGLLGMTAASLLRTPVRIYHCHGLRYETTRGTKRLLLKGAERVTCGLASKVLTVSPSLQAFMLEEGLCPPAKLGMPLRGSIGGVDAEVRFRPPSAADRAAARRALGIPVEARVVGFVGRIVREKGVVELFEAWQRLRQRMSDLHWLVVGPFEEGDPVPPSVASAMRSDPRVHLSGLSWDTPRLFSAMDVVALPSYREGFPVVVLEAAAMALPVVASRATGCADAVVHGVTGVLVGTRDAAGLERALGRYLEDPELRRSHGEAGRARVVRQYRPEELHRAVREVYEAALSSDGTDA